jgi:hypothetical protein
MVVERAVLLEQLHELRNGRALLADRDVHEYRRLDGGILSLVDFWTRMVSIRDGLAGQRSPMINSRWPRPMGTSASSLDASVHGLAHRLAGQ